MNYHAPSRRTQVQGKDGQIRQIFAEIWKIIKTCFDSIKSLIEAVLQCLGIDWLPNLAGQIGAPSCAACICAGFLGITVALGISLGVGLGVGLHCADKVAVQSNVGIIAMNATTSTVQSNVGIIAMNATASTVQSNVGIAAVDATTSSVSTLTNSDITFEEFPDGT